MPEGCDGENLRPNRFAPGKESGYREIGGWVDLPGPDLEGWRYEPWIFRSVAYLIH